MKTREEIKIRLREIVKNDYVTRHDRRFGVWKLAILTVEILIDIREELSDIREMMEQDSGRTNLAWRGKRR